MPPRVLFIHGLESSPQGTKARVLAEHFESIAPAMDTKDFEACVRRQAEAVRRFDPDVVVGSSFGGAVAVALLQRGLWRGPTLLLAQAARSYGLPERLPDDVRVWLVHGTHDDIVPIEASRALARAGERARVRLIEVDDGHRLEALVASGRLVELVNELDETDRAGRRGLVRHLVAFLEEPTLWPVAIVVVAHFAVFGAWLLVTALRNRSPFGALAIALLVVMSGDGLRRARQTSHPRFVVGGILALWVLSAGTAWLTARYDVF